MTLGDNGANVFRDNVTTGFQGWLSSCDALTTKTGNVPGPTVQGLDQRMINGFSFNSQCPGALTGAPVQWSQCPRVIVIALIPPLANGHTDTQILTFAWFYVLDWQQGGNTSSQLSGYFLDVHDRHAPPGTSGGGTVWTPDSSLPFGVKLIA